MYGMVEHVFDTVAFHNAMMDRFQPLTFTPSPLHDPNRDWIRHAAPQLSRPEYLPPALRRHEYYPDLLGGYKPYR